MGQGVADIVGIFRLYGFLYRISIKMGIRQNVIINTPNLLLLSHGTGLVLQRHIRVVNRFHLLISRLADSVCI